MSKQPKRKITVDLGGKPPEAARPSVFERLGTKKAASKKTGGGEREHCRQWAAHGVCAYGKGCKFATTHTLVSPSKARAASKDDSGGGARLHSAVVRPDELDTWDQNDLEYADTDVLEKRRQQLQRELELQLKMDSGKPERKTKKKPPSSSSSSRSSSSSSASTSTTGGSSTSSSSERDRKKGKKPKGKRNSSSSSDDSPSKKKKFSKDSVSRSKSATSKKTAVKKDDRLVKKHDSAVAKKKVLLKMTLTRKKSLSPVKKASATPPIKGLAKNYRKHSKSPVRREKNRSISPTSIKEKEKERQRERDREREKDRDRSRKSRSVQHKPRSRSPRRSHPKEQRRKESPERSRPISPKKARRDQSSDKHRKSPMRDRDRRDHKDKSLDRRKDEKDRHEREKLLARQRERPKDTKRDTAKRGRERREADRGLEKPSKPMERLLPRPEERLAALAAISNRNLEDKSSTNSKDRQNSDRGRKQDRMERDRRERSSKRDRMSMDRDQGDYERGLERGYDRGHSMDRNYERVGERYDDGPREGDNRSPGYGRERHYDPGYDIPGHPRYSDPEERGYGEHMGDHRGVDMGFDERRRREHSWEGSGSLERERVYHGHQHKEWEGEEFHSGPEWGRERHWQHRDPQMGEWVEKEAELEPGWHHCGHPPPAPHRSRMHDDGYGRNMRMEQHAREPMGGKRRSGQQRVEQPAPSPGVKAEPGVAPAPAEPTPADGEEMPVPDDLSEISDDPDDILNRDDMMERGEDNTQPERQPSEERAVRAERAVKTETHNDAHTNHTQEASGAASPAAARAESQDGNDEDIKELDFEEISDGELEEERARAGLGDALGVDWASLVAEVRRSKEPGPPSGAQRRWQPAGVLARVGVSVAMAGAAMAADVIAESRGDSNQSPVHPVASIQVAMERRKRQRAALFGTGCDVTRALSARRDLALRRHLCSLPPVERSGHGRGSTQPHLFHAARTLLMQSG